MSTDKASRYTTSIAQIRSLLEDLTDPVAAMASVAAVLHQNLPWASWVGFYRVVEPNLLRIGPYQGPVGCLEIAFSQGVCGAAASSRTTQVVANVHAFEGHIACDPTSQSEIVVPIFDSESRLIGVLDLDSRDTAAFDEIDAKYLQMIAALMTAAVDQQPRG
jgi:GAF domain-containing protein